jgi:hypothetical protein
MEMCYAAARGNREAKALRRKWRRHPRYGKFIADFDAKRLRRGRGQPKGFAHDRLLERNRYIIALLESAQSQIADQTGLVNTLGDACCEVEKYVNKREPYRDRPGEVYFDEKGRRFTRTKIWNIMRRHITGRNKIRHSAK